MNRILGVALAALSLAIVPSANAQERLDLQLIPLTLSPPITCKNPGSSQDVVKTPYLVNTGLYAIPAGKKLTV